MSRELSRVPVPTAADPTGLAAEIARMAAGFARTAPGCADDLAQEAAVAVLRAAGRSAAARHPAAYLLGVARRAMLDYLRAAGPAAAPLDDRAGPADPAAGPAHAAAVELAAAGRLAPAASPTAAAVAALVHGRGLTAARAAAELGIARVTARGHLARYHAHAAAHARPAAVPPRPPAPGKGRGPRADPAPAVSAAAAWLADYLRGGPRTAAAARRAAARAGIRPRTLDRARAEIGVRARKRGSREHGYWVWHLPGTPFAAPASKNAN